MMEAKDTVMDDNQRKPFGCQTRNMSGLQVMREKPRINITGLLKAQADISFKAGKKKAVEFIELYLVTTVHPEGNMHHIDDKEWQSVKLRLLR